MHSRIGVACRSHGAECTKFSTKKCERTLDAIAAAPIITSDLRAKSVQNGITTAQFPDTAYFLTQNSSACKLESLVIPDGIVEIPDNMLLGCGALTSLVIPASVTKIGFAAFMGCINLKIDFGGTKEQWDKIDKDGYWWTISVNRPQKVNCTDGQIVYEN